MEASSPRTQIRRRDRAIEDDGVRALLERAAFGVLATASGDQPFVNTNLFVYDEGAHVMYMHTARDGRTRANVEANPRVCFTVSEMGRLLPADEALEFSVEYTGATVFGNAEVVQDPEEKRQGLYLLLNKYFPHLQPGEHYRPITDGELRRTTVFKIHIEEWSGKQKRVAEDFPGAFDYGRPPSTT